MIDGNIKAAQPTRCGEAMDTLTTSLGVSSLILTGVFGGWVASVLYFVPHQERITQERDHEIQLRHKAERDAKSAREREGDAHQEIARLRDAMVQRKQQWWIPPAVDDGEERIPPQNVPTTPMEPAQPKE